jgi:hypothetical protein
VEPAAGTAISPAGSGSVPPSTSMRLPSAAIFPGKQFIGGVPMNWATNVFTGRAYTSCGVPTCWSLPMDMTATRVAMVMASTWSWVT